MAQQRQALQQVKVACSEALAGCLGAFPDVDLLVSGWADPGPTRRMLDAVDQLVRQTALQNPEMLSYWAHRKQQSASTHRRHKGSAHSATSAGGSTGGGRSSMSNGDGGLPLHGGGAAPDVAETAVAVAAPALPHGTPMTSQRSDSLQERVHSSHRLLEAARRSASTHPCRAGGGAQPGTASQQPPGSPSQDVQAASLQQQQPTKTEKSGLAAQSTETSAHSFGSAPSGGPAVNSEQMEAYIAQVTFSTPCTPCLHFMLVETAVLEPRGLIPLLRLVVLLCALRRVLRLVVLLCAESCTHFSRS